jgi:hypothetical protein
MSLLSDVLEGKGWVSFNALNFLSGCTVLLSGFELCYGLMKPRSLTKWCLLRRMLWRDALEDWHRVFRPADY